MPIQRINGVDYHFSVRGTGPPLCLLHGFTGSGRSWDEISPRLAANHQVISVDLLGHGRTAVPDDPQRYAMPAAAADLDALLRTITTAPVHLLGYSMGGRLALYFARHYPHRLRSLLLESSSPGLATAAERDARRRRDNALADWIETHDIIAFVERWEALPLWVSQTAVPAAKRAALHAQRRQNNRRGLANSLRGMGTGVQPALWNELPAFPLPVQLIAGELDEKFVQINKKMAALLPAARLEIVPMAGHTVHWERPNYYTKIVRAFTTNRI